MRIEQIGGRDIGQRLRRTHARGAQRARGGPVEVERSHPFLAVVQREREHPRETLLDRTRREVREPVLFVEVRNRDGATCVVRLETRSLA